jgi:hypothetical protein
VGPIQTIKRGQIKLTKPLEANNQGQNCVLYAEALADLPGAHRHRLVFQTKIEKYLDSNCPLHDIG